MKDGAPPPKRARKQRIWFAHSVSKSKRNGILMTLWRRHIATNIEAAFLAKLLRERGAC